MATAKQETGNGNGLLKYVGTRPVRPDGVDKVTGRAKFGADFSLPGMLVGRVLRSPHAHARIRSIDTSKARALTGVKAVVTRDEIAGDPEPVGAGRRGGGQLPRHVAERHGAGEGALRRSRRCGGGGDHDGHCQAGNRSDRGGLRGSAARDRRARGDEA